MEECKETPAAFGTIRLETTTSPTEKIRAITGSISYSHFCYYC
jgi:hypothetical protein